MNEDQIKSGFQELAKNRVPENDQPWHMIANSLNPTNIRDSNRAGVRRLTINHSRLSISGVICLLIIMLSVLFFATPAGRTLAQNMISFFSHTEQDWKTLPTGVSNQTSELIGTIEETKSLSQTPAEFFAFQRQRSKQESSTTENMSLEQAAAMVDYPLKEPLRLPEGYQFNKAVYLSQTNSIWIVYGYQPTPKGEMIMLTLSPTLIMDEVGPEAKVEKIKIHDFDGEMVQGGWLALAGDDREYWEPRMPVTTMRWFDGDLYIKLQFLLNEPSSGSYLDLSQMIQVAESIPVPNQEPVTPEENLTVTPTLIPSNSFFQKMEKEFGYDLLEPGFLPTEYRLTEIVQVPGGKQIDAYYQPFSSDETGPRLKISQIPLSLIPQIKPQNYPPEVEMVDILGSQGRLMEGVDDGSGSYPSWFLFWETQNNAISLWYYPGPETDEKTAKAMLISIAKSMK